MHICQIYLNMWRISYLVPGPVILSCHKYHIGQISGDEIFGKAMLIYEDNVCPVSVTSRKHLPMCFGSTTHGWSTTVWVGSRWLPTNLQQPDYIKINNLFCQQSIFFFKYGIFFANNQHFFYRFFANNQISWYYIFPLILQVTVSGVESGNLRSTLTIRKVERESSGNYSCQPSMVSGVIFFAQTIA